MAGKQGITAKEALFCQYYASGRDARAAAAKAGYRLWPEKTATKLLEKRGVQKQIQSIAEKRTVTAQEVREGYRRLAFGSVADALSLLWMEEVPSQETLECMDLFVVSDIKRPKAGGLEIKFFDRLRALEKLDVCTQVTDKSTAQDFLAALDSSAKQMKQTGARK